MTLPPTAQKLLGALVELGGNSTPGQAGALAQLPPRTVTRAGEALRSAGLVEGGKAQLHLTAAGWAARPGAEPAVSAGPVLDQALELWADLDLYAHRAFLELLCSAVVGRARLADVRPEGHLGFMALGDTGTGKSALAGMVCTVFGLDTRWHTLTLPSQNSGAVLGRRESAVGVGQRWVWVPSPLAALPFVLFDEFDKADDLTRKAVLPYFQGDVEVQAESELQRLRPTPMLAANPPQRGDRRGQLRGEYRRRSVLLDTAYAEDRGGDIERALTAYYARPQQQLQLAGLPQPANELPPLAQEVLANLDRALTPEGRKQRPPSRALEVAVLGRAALAGASSEQALVLAAYSVGVAYLQVTEQLGDQVDAGWQLDFDKLRKYLGVGVGVGAGADELEAVVVASRHARTQSHAQVARRRVAHEVEDLQLVGDRHALAEQLRLATAAIDGRKVPDQDKPAASGLREQLRKQRTSVLDCRSQRRLEDLRTLVAGPLEQAVAMRQRLDVEQRRRRAEAQQAKADDAAQERQARDIARQHTAVASSHRRAQLQQARARLVEVRSLAKAAEVWWSRTTTPKNAPPWRDLERRELLRYEPPAQEPEGERPGVMARLSRVLTSVGGQWVATGDPRVRFPGTRAVCRELESWGPGTQSVLLPWLVALHAEEDQLVAEFGLRARPSRPALYAPARALPSGRPW